MSSRLFEIRRAATMRACAGIGRSEPGAQSGAAAPPRESPAYRPPGRYEQIDFERIHYFRENTTNLVGDLAFALEALAVTLFQPREIVIRQRKPLDRALASKRDFTTAADKAIGIITLR